MTNFAFLPDRFKDIAESARRAEGHILGDPRAACFYARLTLESIAHWLYRYERDLKKPYDQSLSALVYEPSFRQLVGDAVFQKAKAIIKQGNQAVHERRAVEENAARQVVKELHHICYWLTRTYEPRAPRDGAGWQEERVPQPQSGEAVVPRAELAALEARYADDNMAHLKGQLERDALNAEVQELRAQLTKAREAAQRQPDTHDYSEAETRHYLIDLDLHRAGWPLDKPEDREYPVEGMPNAQGKGYVDYVLWGDDGLPLAVVEAKRATMDPERGRQQAKLYADCLEKQFGRRPLIFYTNGYHFWLWDDSFYPPRQVAGFFTQDELTHLIQMRDKRKQLDGSRVNPAIAGRYYQKRAIQSVCEHFQRDHQRKALLVMATGTGKTRTAIALVDVLMKAGWVKRTLFLADRLSLVSQATNAFKAQLPESSPVNLVTQKNTQGRVYTCTYPTLMGLIDENRENGARFGPGYFDLVIVDEAHRSIYQKYGAIFRYFDALLVGLTATPSNQVDRNTYHLFDLEPGVPTDAYELGQAIQDGYLVPPKVRQVDMKFPRQGIVYDELSEAEKAEWEALDWGDDAEEVGAPREVNASAVNNWLFNKDTVDRVLQYLMEHGYHVDGGDRLAKTIIFARNHQHAAFIEERFNHHYPQHAGSFARVIDNQVNYAQSLIDDFGKPDSAPHIAISVDMLDTGIDVPEVANLVFFKPVYSRIKFWQMVGRGTRLRPELYGPRQDENDDSNDKQDFRIFDFCFNYDFFRENPDGIEPSAGLPLGARLFVSRIQLLSTLQATPEQDDGGQLTATLTDELQGRVKAMNPRNFLVRLHLDQVEKYGERGAWENLNDDDRQRLTTDIARLPSEQEVESIDTRRFDLLALGLQLTHLQHDAAGFEERRRKVADTAALLEEKTSIPLVRAQLGYLQAIQESGFWEGINVNLLEELRQRLRGLVPCLDSKSKRTLVYTDFQDQILGVREEAGGYTPKMTGVQYEKKVKAYLQAHLNNIVIHRLRGNKPLTQTDLDSLQTILEAIGEEEGQALLQSLIRRHEAPSLAHFIRTLVGLDRAAATEAFAQYLTDSRLSTAQMRFVKEIIEQLCARGLMPAKALYEPPFSNLHAGGPDALFAGQEQLIDGLFAALRSTEPRVHAARQ